MFPLLFEISILEILKGVKLSAMSSERLAVSSRVHATGRQQTMALWFLRKNEKEINDSFLDAFFI